MVPGIRLVVGCSGPLSPTSHADWCGTHGSRRRERNNGDLEMLQSNGKVMPAEWSLSLPAQVYRGSHWILENAPGKWTDFAAQGFSNGRSGYNFPTTKKVNPLLHLWHGPESNERSACLYEQVPVRKFERGAIEPSLANRYPIEGKRVKFRIWRSNIP
ncbi:hypothetical protein DFH06DRAFT_1125166 [Mycena polygramma]|nr:hypothetical protein DFH06DRAFT_1125166 [Mycena polygramma]